MTFDFKKLLHILFPPSKDMLLVQDAQALTPLHINVDGNTCLLAFRDPLVRACIHEAKFHYNQKAFGLLADVLADYIGTDYDGACLVIPMPLSSARMRERGYNQVTEVVKCVVRNMPATEIHEKVLKRTKNTKPQTSLGRNERLHNVTNAFGIRDRYAEDINGKHIILVDDVLTTGATMKAARLALLRYCPASVTCVALAH